MTRWKAFVAAVATLLTIGLVPLTATSVAGHSNPSQSQQGNGGGAGGGDHRKCDSEGRGHHGGDDGRATGNREHRCQEE